MKIYTATRGKRLDDKTVKVDGRVLSPEPSQALRNHSPDGFEWGYGGSGPSQLALAILLDYLGNDRLALKHYQEFKWAFISSANQDGFVISGDDISAWLSKQILSEDE